MAEMRLPRPRPRSPKQANGRRSTKTRGLARPTPLRKSRARG